MSNVFSKTGFVLLNAWLVFHLFCIVAGPSSVYPSSELEQSAWRIAKPYLQFLYMNHGWKYFSPQPGGANLLTFEMSFPDGQQESLTFPTQQIEPRLLYHRYFMMSEYLGNSSSDRQTAWAKSFARKLCLQDDAQSVSVTKVFHDLPSRVEFLAGRHLDDESLYHKEKILEYRRGQYVEVKP